jgi:replicative DNA helicase
MLGDQSFCSKATRHLKDEFFSGELSWFFRQIREHFEQHKIPPTVNELKVYVGRHGANASTYQKELDSIASADDIGKDFLKRELTAFIQANIFVSSVRQSADLYNTGSREECYRFIKDKLNELHEADFENDRLVHFGDAERMMEIARLQSRDAVPTGLRAIDEAMLGGMMPQTWTTFLGGSNVGKSMLCPNIAKAAWTLKQKRTFVMVHEDEEVPTYLRYLACFSDIPYNRLTLPRGDLDAAELLRIKQADDTLKEAVCMKFMYGKEAFIEVVCEEARRLKERWEYHLLLDDYPQCLKTRSFKSMEDLYSLYEYTTQEFKQLCCELNIAGGGGAQTNRLGHRVNQKGGDLLRCTDVGDSWGIIKKSSNVVTFNRSETDKQLNRATYLLDKVRNGRCPVAVQCITAYEKCQTFLPWSEVNANQTEIQITE